jgi:hypothetical protein
MTATAATAAAATETTSFQRLGAWSLVLRRARALRRAIGRPRVLLSSRGVASRSPPPHSEDCESGDHHSGQESEMGAGWGRVLLLRYDEPGCQGRAAHELALRVGSCAYRRGRAESRFASAGALMRCRGARSRSSRRRRRPRRTRRGEARRRRPTARRCSRPAPVRLRRAGGGRRRGRTPPRRSR